MLLTILRSGGAQAVNHLRSFCVLGKVYLGWTQDFWLFKLTGKLNLARMSGRVDAVQASVWGRIRITTGSPATSWSCSSGCGSALRHRVLVGLWGHWVRVACERTRLLWHSWHCARLEEAVGCCFAELLKLDKVFFVDSLAKWHDFYFLVVFLHVWHAERIWGWCCKAKLVRVSLSRVLTLLGIWSSSSYWSRWLTICSLPWFRSRFNSGWSDCSWIVLWVRDPSPSSALRWSWLLNSWNFWFLSLCLNLLVLLMIYCSLVYVWLFFNSKTCKVIDMVRTLLIFLSKFFVSI